MSLHFQPCILLPWSRKLQWWIALKNATVIGRQKWKQIVMLLTFNITETGGRLSLSKQCKCSAGFVVCFYLDLFLCTNSQSYCKDYMDVNLYMWLMRLCAFWWNIWSRVYFQKHLMNSLNMKMLSQRHFIHRVNTAMGAQSGAGLRLVGITGLRIS